MQPIDESKNTDLKVSWMANVQQRYPSPVPGQKANLRKSAALYPSTEMSETETAIQNSTSQSIIQIEIRGMHSKAKQQKMNSEEEEEEEGGRGEANP